MQAVLCEPFPENVETAEAMDKLTEIRLDRLDENQKTTTVWLEGLDNRIAEIGRDIVQIRTAIQPRDLPWAVRFILLPLTVAAAVATVGAVIHLEIAVSGIRPLQTKQVLSAITTQATVLQAEGKTPSEPAIRELTAASKTVVSAIDKYPHYPEVWKAASALVNTRSLTSGQYSIPPDILEKVGPATTNRGDCFSLPTPEGGDKLGPMPPSLNNYAWIVSLPWHDCTLYLDNLEGFNRSTLKAYLDRTAGSNTEHFFVELTVVRVNIVYHGGPIIPISSLTAYGCTFGFDMPKLPPAKGKELVVALLSEDYGQSPVHIVVPHT